MDTLLSFETPQPEARFLKFKVGHKYEVGSEIVTNIRAKVVGS